MNIPRGERRQRYFAETGVFWDVGDYTIPEGCVPESVYATMKRNFMGFGFDGDITIWAYKESNTMPIELVNRFRDVGIIFKSDVPDDKHARVRKMLVDTLLFVLDKRPAVNWLLISKDFSQSQDTLLTSLLHAFKARNYVALAGLIDMYHPVLKNAISHITEGSITIDKRLERIIDTSVARGWPEEPGNGLFWDVVDYPIPTGLSDDSIYLNIGSALCHRGHRGDVSIWAYGEKQTFPEDSDPDSKFKIGFVPDGPNYSRGFKMLLDMLLWALDNPVEHDEVGYPTLMILSKNISEETDFTRVVQALENRYYDVRVSEPDKVPRSASFGLVY
ncbi:uncharacterized protein LOC17899214 isoform X2 [Capsella rubella]|uniref:uncharacterized protein LOC17899214 isoform X2 n=1 Tax=Capsella rubella TaxID=81985 RepID=UPI000CD4D859|nr:uncharacterized protein LOC17899214 isoform X2 [Capsella rubella]